MRDFRKISDKIYEDQLKEIDNYLMVDNEDKEEYEFIEKKYINEVIVKDIKNTFYIYIFFNNHPLRESINDDYLSSKIFLMGLASYPKKNSYVYFTDENKTDLNIEKEIKYKCKEYPELDLRIRLINKLLFKNTFEKENWNFQFIEYKRTHINMTLKDIILNIMTKNIWKHYEVKEFLNYTIEKTLTTDNTLFLSTKIRIKIDKIIYELNGSYRDLFESIYENI